MGNFLGTMIGVLFLMMPSISHAALRVVTTTQDPAALTEVVGGDQVNVESLTLGTRDPLPRECTC